MSLRSFIYESKAESALKKLDGIDRRRADEMIRAIEWILTRSPEEGIPIVGFTPTTYIFKTDTKHEVIETITVIYRITDDAINILDIRYISRTQNGNSKP